MLLRLVVWIVLLTLPLQGMASMAMVHCGMSAARHEAADDRIVITPANVSQSSDHIGAHQALSAHDGDANMLDTRGSDAERAMLRHASVGYQSAGHDAHDHDAPCCAAAFAITGSLPRNFPPGGPPADLVYDPGVLPTVYLEGLRRPPRLSLV